MIRFLKLKLQIHPTKPEDEIITQGLPLEKDPEENFVYMIATGQCVVYCKDRQKEKDQDTKVRTLLPGDLFGEMALIHHCKRTATVQTNNYCTLAKLSQKHIYQLQQ